MSKKSRDPSLFKIIAGIIVIGALVLGVLQAANYIQNYIDKGVEAAALENLDKARTLVDKGDTIEAEKLLRPILARVKDPTIKPQALMLQARLDQESGNIDAALEHMRSAAEDFEGSSEQAPAALAYARLLEENGQGDQALETYVKLRDTAPPRFRAPALVSLGIHEEQQGNREESYALYQQAMADAESGGDTWFNAARRYGSMNVADIFASHPTADSKVYRVSSGDSLTSIGMKLNTTQGLLMKANNMDNPNRLRLNQNLKYTPKDFEIVIDRSNLRLYLLDKDGIFHVYQVGLGRPGNDTTLGKYHIGNKEKDPTWYKPGFGPIPPGDPDNELGTRWMPLIPEEEGLPTDLGIHGTIEPDTIGLFTSMGCPRLLNEQAEELYDLVVRSTPVRVVDKFDFGLYEQ